MADYKKMYYTLFNVLTDTIEQLKKAQEECEEIYMETDDTFEKPSEDENGR